VCIIWFSTGYACLTFWKGTDEAGFSDKMFKSETSLRPTLHSGWRNRFRMSHKILMVYDISRIFLAMIISIVRPLVGEPPRLVNKALCTSPTGFYVINNANFGSSSFTRVTLQHERAQASIRTTVAPKTACADENRWLENLRADDCCSSQQQHAPTSTSIYNWNSKSNSVHCSV
jgi:hypothetical protein